MLKVLGQHRRATSVGNVCTQQSALFFSSLAQASVLLDFFFCGRKRNDAARAKANLLCFTVLLTSCIAAVHERYSSVCIPFLA